MKDRKGGWERDNCTFELWKQFRRTVARVTSYFTLVALLVGETLLWSPPGEGKHLELIFPSLGKNSCQQLAAIHKSLLEDEHYLSNLPEDFFFVNRHICSHPHVYMHIYMYIYEDGCIEV